MKAKDIMTTEPTCCTPDTPLTDAARMMRDEDCGSIPVLKDGGRGAELVGIVTDRDIVVRCIAEGHDVRTETVEHCMSSSVASVTQDASLEECMELMEQHQIRRVPVVDDKGCCCGIVAQADIALHTTPTEAGEVVREVSQHA